MRTVLAPLLLALFASVAGAAPLDEWCAQVTLPSSIAICSDPELRTLAIERQKAFDEVRARLGEERAGALLADQKGWVASYPKACGVSPDRSPRLPLAPEVRDCMARAGRARIAYLKAYGAASEAAAAPKASESRAPSGQTPPGSTSSQTIARAEEEARRCIGKRIDEVLTRQIPGELGNSATTEITMRCVEPLQRELRNHQWSEAQILDYTAWVAVSEQGKRFGVNVPHKPDPEDAQRVTDWHKTTADSHQQAATSSAAARQRPDTCDQDRWEDRHGMEVMVKAKLSGIPDSAVYDLGVFTFEELGKACADGREMSAADLVTAYLFYRKR